jgi:hypothetical protein
MSPASLCGRVPINKTGGFQSPISLQWYIETAPQFLPMLKTLGFFSLIAGISDIALSFRLFLNKLDYA